MGIMEHVTASIVYKYMLQSKVSKTATAFIILLSELSERDRIILIERFIRKKSLKKVSKELDISDISVKQIEDKLIRNIDQTFEFIHI